MLANAIPNDAAYSQAIYLNKRQTRQSESHRQLTHSASSMAHKTIQPIKNDTQWTNKIALFLPFFTKYTLLLDYQRLYKNHMLCDGINAINTTTCIIMHFVPQKTTEAILALQQTLSAGKYKPFKIHLLYFFLWGLVARFFEASCDAENFLTWLHLLLYNFRSVPYLTDPSSSQKPNAWLRVGSEPR